jgi:catechol 2,3-dioxygenase-like lactoylglutathione lyase family enzyme
MELHAPDYVILIVDDLDRTLDFYTQVLGLRLGHRSGEYAQLDTECHGSGGWLFSDKACSRRRRL